MPEDDEKRERYLVANTRPLDLADLAKKWQADPACGIGVVEVIVGVDGSVILDLEMTPGRAQQLRQESGPRILVEPNAVVEPINVWDG